MDLRLSLPVLIHKVFPEPAWCVGPHWAPLYRACHQSKYSGEGNPVGLPPPSLGAHTPVLIQTPPVDNRNMLSKGVRYHFHAILIATYPYLIMFPKSGAPPQRMSLARLLPHFPQIKLGVHVIYLVFPRFVYSPA